MLRGLGLEPGPFLLFAAARVDPTKGCHTLLEAMASRPVPTPVLILGDLGHAAGYEDRLRSLAAGLLVRFHPRVEDPCLLRGILQSARMFVFPSEVEAMSMMLLEAVASGVPVVPSDIPENLDVLPPGFATFRTGDAMDLARRIAEMDATIDAGGWRSEEPLAWVRDHHNWDRIAELYEAAYADAVRGR
jgi:glycosyltransferase involved in cell wall biosynthesis